MGIVCNILSKAWTQISDSHTQVRISEIDLYLDMSRISDLDLTFRKFGLYEIIRNSIPNSGCLEFRLEMQNRNFLSLGLNPVILNSDLKLMFKIFGVETKIEILVLVLTHVHQNLRFRTEDSDLGIQS